MRIPGRSRVQGRVAVSAGIAPGAAQISSFSAIGSKVGAEMHRTLVDQDRLFGRFDPDIAVHRLVGELRLVGTHDHTDVADAQARRRSHLHVAAAIIGAGRHELAVRQFFDDEAFLIRRVARDAGLAAERKRHGGADARGMRGLGRLRIVDHAGRRARRLVADQRAQHACRVGIAAGAGIVLGVGDDDRLAGVLRQLHGVAHAVVGRIDAAVEIVLMALDQRHQFVGGCIRIGLRRAVGEYAGATIPEIGGRKSGRE